MKVLQVNIELNLAEEIWVLCSVGILHFWSVLLVGVWQQIWLKFEKTSFEAEVCKMVFGGQELYLDWKMVEVF